ncbi:unnamed protein product, partial [Bubo scandiacus]
GFRTRREESYLDFSHTYKSIHHLKLMFQVNTLNTLSSLPPLPPAPAQHTHYVQLHVWKPSS